MLNNFTEKSKVKIVTILGLVLILTHLNSAQNLENSYFPLAIGNRWDYYSSNWCHGGVLQTDTFSVEVIEQINFKTERDYYILSNNTIFETKYLSLENDSLYYFNTEDSVDCLMFVFNKSFYGYYYSCKFDPLDFCDELHENWFGWEDTQQYHITYSNSYKFSKKFGYLGKWDISGGICEHTISLSGCILSGEIFGNLAVTVEDNMHLKNGYNLIQNYPNPFNPNTTIHYSISKQSFVTLKVYDLLGREVATLINEEKQAGNYEVEFDGSNLPSGVYFYQLRVSALQSKDGKANIPNRVRDRALLKQRK